MGFQQETIVYLLLLCLIQLFLTSCFMLTVYINYHIVHPVAYIGDFQNPQYFWGICKLNGATQIEISKLISRSCKFSNCAEHTCTYIKATVYWMHRLPITVMCHHLIFNDRWMWACYHLFPYQETTCGHSTNTSYCVCVHVVTHTVTHIHV